MTKTVVCILQSYWKHIFSLESPLNHEHDIHLPKCKTFISFCRGLSINICKGLAPLRALDGQWDGVTVTGAQRRSGFQLFAHDKYKTILSLYSLQFLLYVIDR